MENNEVEKVVIDEVEYEVNSLSDKAKICITQLKDLQNQINISLHLGLNLYKLETAGTLLI